MGPGGKKRFHFSVCGMWHSAYLYLFDFRVHTLGPLGMGVSELLKHQAHIFSECVFVSLVLCGSKKKKKKIEGTPEPD